MSPWLVGWIIGIEWDLNFVINTNNQHPDKKDYDGKYLYTQTASPFEAFLCRVGDALIKHEAETYKFQVPLAFSNWITTDPLTHPNEPHFDEDKATVNTENVKSRNFGPGMFASYHIYPYYPDSLNYQEDYLEYTDDSGKVNTYEAYLEDLKLAHTMPIIVAEFGIPTSRGMGHESVMGYNQSMAAYVDGDVSEWKNTQPTVTTEQGKLYIKSDERYLYIMLDAGNYDFEKDTLLIPINTIADQGNLKAAQYNAEFDTAADFLIYINGKNNSHIYVDRYYDAFNYYFLESKKLSDIKAEENAGVKNSGMFDIMRLCYGYNLTVKGTNQVVPDKAYETGKLRYGNGNPKAQEYKSLSDFYFKNGKLEIRIPWQLLNVMDPSGKQQISDFRKTQVISPQAYQSFDFGFAYRTGTESLKITLGGSYEYNGWNTPTWHERLKPAYYELQNYFKKFTEKK